MNNFDLDFEFGTIYEEKLEKILRGNKVEVKTERFDWQETGNIAIEIKYYGKDSGLCATDADYWFHLLTDSNGKIVGGFFFPVPELRKMVRNFVSAGLASVVKGGDNNASTLVLVPICRIRRMIMSVTSPGNL